MKLNIVLVLGARSEWGYIKPVYDELKRRGHEPYIWACNMAVSSSYGNIVIDIERQGYRVCYKSQTALDGGTFEASSKSLSLVISEASTWISNNDVDWVVVSGDRPEQFGFLIASAFAYVPTGHIQAGERSGNIDGLTRHAMARLAHVHFAANLDAYNRLIRSGEEEWRVMLSGAPQLDGLVDNILNWKQLSDHLNLEIDEDFALSIFHANTDELGSDVQHLQNIIEALEAENIRSVWIAPNNDPGSRELLDFLQVKVGHHNRVHTNLPRNVYASLMAHAQFMIGNSSSGILEAPYFNLPSVNVGDRQRDRYRASNVIDTEPAVFQIREAILKAMNLRQHLSSEMEAPYGDGKSAERIVDSLENLLTDREMLLRKTVVF